MIKIFICLFVVFSAKLFAEETYRVVPRNTQWDSGYASEKVLAKELKKRPDDIFCVGTFHVEALMRFQAMRGPNFVFWYIPKSEGKCKQAYLPLSQLLYFFEAEIRYENNPQQPLVSLNTYLDLMLKDYAAYKDDFLPKVVGEPVELINRAGKKALYNQIRFVSILINPTTHRAVGVVSKLEHCQVDGPCDIPQRLFPKVVEEFCTGIFAGEEESCSFNSYLRNLPGGQWI
jgi:hypothetical protein